MRLLILTQAVDRNDPVLGFFHQWIKEFSNHADEVIVGCLRMGEYELPGNVRVVSLGKERGASRWEIIRNFYRLIMREQKHYDAVFVHMNQEYVLLGGIFWRLAKKTIFLWRNHHHGNFFTRVAVFLAHKVLCTSNYSYTASFKKTTIMPVGIDTTIFSPVGSLERKPLSILYVGRISPVKRVHLLVEATRLLVSRGFPVTLFVYGDALPRDAQYLKEMQKGVQKTLPAGTVIFCRGVPNKDTPSLYSTSEVFVNASPSGMFDKTIFEAMACQALCVTSNENLKGSLEPAFLFEEGDVQGLADRLEYVLTLSVQEKNRYGILNRSFVCERHSLTLLAKKLFGLFRNEMGAVRTRR